MPLAIVLAAARTQILTVPQLLERIDRRFDVIGALATSIRASCDLLTSPQAALFRACSAFAGSFDVTALDAMLPETDLISPLGALVDQSMIVVTRAPGSIRYHLLESLRTYGRQWATDLTELASLRDRHAEWAAELVQSAARNLNGIDQAAHLKSIDVEYDNISSAIAWLIETGSSALAIPTATAFGRYTRRRARPLEGIAWLERALALPDACSAPGHTTARNELGLLYIACGRLDDAERIFRSIVETADIAKLPLIEIGRAWDNLGLALRNRGDVPGAIEAHQTGLTICFAAGDNRAASSCRLNLALAANLGGDLPAARDGCFEALALLGGEEDLWSVATILSNLGEIATRQERTDEAADYYERVVEIYRRLDDRDHLAVVAANTAEIRLLRGEPERALRLIADAVAQFRLDHNLVQLAPTLYLQASAFAARGRNHEALTAFRESIQLSHTQGNAFDVAYSLEAIARIHLLAGDPRLALRLWGGMETLRAAESVPEYPLLTYRDTRLQLQTRTGGNLPADPEYQRGARMSQAALVTEAITLGAVVDGLPVDIYRVISGVPPHRPTDLRPTPRQREILVLMAAGRTNREIARDLGISPRTVERHISQIFALLGADRRSAATAIATALGLLETT